MVDPDSHQVSRVWQYSGTSSKACIIHVQDSNLLWFAFSYDSICYMLGNLHSCWPYNPGEDYSHTGLTYIPVRSPLLGESQLISVPSDT